MTGLISSAVQAQIEKVAASGTRTAPKLNIPSKRHHSTEEEDVIDLSDDDDVCSYQTGAQSFDKVQKTERESTTVGPDSIKTFPSKRLPSAKAIDVADFRSNPGLLIDNDFTNPPKCSTPSSKRFCAAAPKTKDGAPCVSTEEQALPTPDSTPQKSHEQLAPPKADNQVVDLTDDNDNDDNNSPTVSSTIQKDSAQLKQTQATTQVRDSLDPVQTVPTPDSTSQKSGSQRQQPQTGNQAIDLTGDHDDNTNNMPTPDIATQKNVDKHKEAKLSDRYQINMKDGVEYNNPNKFCLKPPFWQEWDGRDFILLGEQLRASFDVVKFAKEIGRPVEEVQHVFSAVIVNPLYDAKDARNRQRDGLREIMEFYDKQGTPMRPWGKRDANGKRKLGELRRIVRGSVELVTQSGKKMVLSVNDLSDSDVIWLGQELTDEHKRVLWE